MLSKQEPIAVIRDVLHRSCHQAKGISDYVHSTEWLERQLVEMRALARPDGVTFTGVATTPQPDLVEQLHAQQFQFFITNKERIPPVIRTLLEQFSQGALGEQIRGLAVKLSEGDAKAHWIQWLSREEVLNLSTLFFLHAKGIECRVKREADVVPAARESQICFKAAVQSYCRWVNSDHPEWN